MIKTLQLALLLLAAGVTGVGAQTIGGSYKARGKNPDNSGYHEEVEIRANSDTDCNITWAVQPTTKGICLRLDKILVASWTQDGDTGVALYILNQDGTLDGNWALSGESGVGTERLEPAK